MQKDLGKDEGIDTSFRATYRLQIHKDFTLDVASKVTSYIEDLGVSHLYLSPLLEARPGSNHGYDAIDPTRLSEERGGEKAFEKLMARVEKSKSIEGVILDIVPNHVAAHWQNPAWWDLLKNGRESKFYRFFDVRDRGPKDSRVVLPVLGRTLRATMAARELQLDVYDGQLVFRYWDTRFPIQVKSYPAILRAIAKEWPKEDAEGSIQAIESAPQIEKRWSAWFTKLNSAEKKKLDGVLKAVPIRTLESVLRDQNYALEDWRTGSREINYRRFFDINDLAAIRVEDREVFEWAHSKIKSLMDSYPKIRGLRVDHVDGLTDPEAYLRQLKTICDRVWVEKILGDGERIPQSWPVMGTTGYEFSGQTARLFVDLPGLLQLHSHYTRHVDRRWERFHECVYDSKREMLDSHFVSETNYLVDQFHRLAERGGANEFSKEDLEEAFKELTSSLRVYRTYFTEGRASDDRWLREAFAEAEGRGRLTSTVALEFLRSILMGSGDWSESTYMAVKRWEQLTGPVMAKGLEDTALYRYFPLLSLNVVGGEPDWAGDGVIEFHAFNAERMRTQPLSMSTTSTHDTKRSEDVRSRIHVLSEFSETWVKRFEEWHELHAFRGNGSDTGPDRSIEYLIYETLLGAWPLDGKITESFRERMKQYFTKAVREAKSETSWTEPNSKYENDLMKFIDRVLDLDGKKGRKFSESFLDLVEQTSYYGAMNSLGLLCLKVLSPGLPDFYQGCDLWDLSLVDPDNRRPVDYEKREKYLDAIKRAVKGDRVKLGRDLLGRWKTGEIKLWLTWEFLQQRKKDPELFIRGEYHPIELHGENRRHFICFYRRFQNRWAFVIVPRFMSDGKIERLPKRLEVPPRLLKGVEIGLPVDAPKTWTNVLTGEKGQVASLDVRELLAGHPVGVWLGQSK